MGAAVAGVLDGTTVESAGRRTSKLLDRSRKLVEFRRHGTKPVGDAVDGRHADEGAARLGQPGNPDEPSLDLAFRAVAVHLVEECNIAEATGIILRAGGCGRPALDVGNRELIQDRRIAQLL